jgi:3-hydroxyisobutyrate dehydrogenase-like beta-hydroxyacid dehydrogenase
MSAGSSPPSEIPASGDLSMTVGFIGIGRMGLPLARSLLRSHVPLLVHSRTPSKIEPLVAEGARWAATPRDVARIVSKGVVFLMLTDGKAVQKVLFGRGGLARAGAPGLLVADLSTIDPEESRAFAARLNEAGVHYLDAPVGGSVDKAARGEVTFFVGGDESDVARVRPLLERMGRKVEHMGPVGAGASMKLVNNLLTIGITTLTTEALALANGFHLDPGRVLELVQDGGGRSVMLERKASTFLARQYPAQFTTTLARKDLKLVEKAATRQGQPLRMTREARKLLEEAMAQGHSEDDFSSVLEATLARGQPKVPAPVAAPAESSDAPGSPPADGGVF